LRSISEGVRTIITVTERLNELRTEVTALRADLHRLAESVYRIAGRLDGIEQRFAEVDRRIELCRFHSGGPQNLTALFSPSPPPAGGEGKEKAFWAFVNGPTEICLAVELAVKEEFDRRSGSRP
jgi:hypothetical protein